MTKVQKNLIKLAIKRGDIEMAVKLCVIANLQPDGRGVFINEARSTAEYMGLTAAQFAGGLGALTVKGLYKQSQDPEFRGQYGYWKEVQESAE